MVMTSLLSGCARSQDISESAIQALLDRGNVRACRRTGPPSVGAPDSTPWCRLDRGRPWSEMLLKAALLNGKGALPSTRALAERVIERKESLPVDARCCFVRSQVNLADALVGAAEFERASAMLTNAVSELSARPRADPGELADVLDHLGTTLILNEKMDEALVTLRQVSMSGARHLNQIRSVEQDPYCYWAGRFSERANMLRRARRFAKPWPWRPRIIRIIPRTPRR